MTRIPTTPLAAEAMTPAELTAIRRRLHSAGLFAAHAYTDVRRLLDEVDRCHTEIAARDREQAAGPIRDAA